jgi:hypoxanthine-DNA glycosylase
LQRTKAQSLRGFPPVVSPAVELMVLGSFPGRASLEAKAYYAHPRNAFWPLMAAIFDEPFPALPYPDRLLRLLTRRVGLWDVIEACDRAGSLDAAIRNHAENDLLHLNRLLPNLKAVAFNGRTAGRYESVLIRKGLLTAVLPSTSPAHARLAFDAKRLQWQAFFERVFERRAA